MSETVKVGRNRPPQNNEWASKKEVDELRAEVAELRKTNQMMLEEIKGLRAELGGAKRPHFLGAVAASAAAFFSKFRRHDEKPSDTGEEKAKTEAKAKRVEKRADKKPEKSQEQEGKQNKGKSHKKVLMKAIVGALVVALAAGGAMVASGSRKGIQDIPKPTTNMRTVDMNNLRIPEIEQALAEQDAEAAHQQQLAETMGMSVEDMHAVADRHGVEHSKIGTAEAHEQMRNSMESSHNISEKIDLGNMSEAERSERSKQEILFADMNNMYVTAQISSARLGAHDGSDADLTQRLFKQYEENDALWQEHAKENAKFLREATYSTRLAGTSKTYTYGTENQWDGPIEKQYVVENSGGETVYIVEVAYGNIMIQFKDGCVQAVWVEEAAQQHQQVKERVVQQQRGERRTYERRRGEWGREYYEEEGGRRTDAKDPKANDPQQVADDTFTDDSKADDKAPTYGGQENPDASRKAGNTDGDPSNGSEVTPDDKGGSIGEKQQDEPGRQDWGDKGTGQDQGGGRASNPGDQGSSGSGSKETDTKDHQKDSSSWSHKRGGSEGGSWSSDSEGNSTSDSYKKEYEYRTGNDEQSNDDVVLQQSVSVGEYE